MSDDDTFEGTTFIGHGGSHSLPTPNDDAINAQTVASDGLAELEARVAALEEKFEAHKAYNEKKLKALEKLAKHQQLSPEERVFIIQEDA